MSVTYQRSAIVKGLSLERLRGRSLAYSHAVKLGELKENSLHLSYIWNIVVGFQWNSMQWESYAWAFCAHSLLCSLINGSWKSHPLSMCALPDECSQVTCTGAHLGHSAPLWAFREHMGTRGVCGQAMAQAMTSAGACTKLLLVWPCGWVHLSHTYCCAGVCIEPKGLHPECQNLTEVKKAVRQLEIHIVRKVISWFRWCLVCLEVCCPRELECILSCHHIFHERWCIEPWLLGHRTCLKCKRDLLKATEQKWPS